MSTETGTSPILGLMGFWMMMGLVSTLALVLGGLYTLYCMSRFASSMDRLASAVEELVKHQHGPTAETPTRPQAPPVPSVPSTSASAVVIPAPSTTPYNTTNSNPTDTSAPAASSAPSPVGGIDAQRQSDEYPR
jgi:hypothetical protein